MLQLPEVQYGKDMYISDVASQYLQQLKEINVKKANAHDYRLFGTPSNWLRLCHFNDQRIVLDDFQESLVDTMSKLAIAVKCRQTGFSFCMSGRAVAMSHIVPRSFNILCSYNLREAKEKIGIVKIISDGVPRKIRKKMTTDNALEVEYENGSRIYSLFSPRGYSRATVLLDEMAFYEDQQKTYNDAFPVATRHPETQFFIGSSPFGKIGLFYDIVSNASDKFFGFDKHFWFWWDSTYYCKDIKRARKYAHMMPTIERVMEFGTDALIEIYNNMLEEDFQQEFESYFCDDTVSFFSYDLIKSRMGWYNDTDSIYNQLNYPQRLEDIRLWNQGILYAGFDVGRTRNTSEFFCFDYRSHDKDGMEKPKFIQVFNQSFDKTKFRDQKDFLVEFINMYQNQIGCLCIDQNQIGRNLTEDLVDEYPATVMGVNFLNIEKEIMATTTKLYMTDGVIELLPDKETMMHFHSIKQIKSGTGAVTRFDVDGTKKHHADRFWAVGLAVLGANKQIGLKPEIYVAR